MLKPNIARIARALHKWFGLALGFQLLLWSSSGLYMVATRLDFIHGDFLVRPTPPLAIAAPLIPISSLSADHGIVSVKLKSLPGVGHPVYEVRGHDRTRLIDAVTGEPLSPLSHDAIVAIASAWYAGEAKVERAEQLSAVPVEARGRSAPLWRVDFDDHWRARFYLDPDSGNLLARRHRWWRWYDTFWMLHVMDYGDERDDINNLLLRSAAGFSLVLALSGIVLLFFSFGWLRLPRATRHMKFMRQLHRWLALLVGLQVTVWIASGFGMSLLDARAVSGEDQVAGSSDRAQFTPELKLLDADALLATLADRTAVQSLELRRELGFWVWRVESLQGVRLHDARTGDLMQVDAARARWVAQNDYFGDGALTNVSIVTEPTLEARGQALPLWRADFNDTRHTRYYISASEGRIVARRNDTWAWFDLLWMLHTMDYAGRDNFNTPWVIAFASAALWLAISGAILLVRSFRR